MSPWFGCYGDTYATTPHVDRLAREGVRYTRAFAPAPVCSPARSCLFTGLYATTLGTQHLRSQFPIPETFKGYPVYLRRSGYFCSNNVKTDYNLRDERRFVEEAWDECSNQAHWRHRKPGQPFFSVFNLMETHQSRLNVWSFAEFEKEVGQRAPPGQRHDPAQAPVPPYYPDTPLVRRTIARAYDCVTVMDQEVGRILQQLEEDGLAEDTIVFFYADGGQGLPRGKRTLYDAGLRVPLIIRFPPKYQSLAPAAPGQTVDRLVSFVDFAPSLLSLVSVPVPGHMMGRAFLGPAAAEPRVYVYGARDRVDEACDLSRSVRDGRWLYIRNYLPHLSWNQPEGYSDQAELRRELTRLAKAGSLNSTQLTYAGPRKPREELYDTTDDPWQVRNLADTPAHRPVLERLRREHQRWLSETRDLGFLPEAEAWRRSTNTTPWQMARQSEAYPLERILAAADLVGRADVVASQQRLLTKPDAAVRYWAAVGLRAVGPQAQPARDALRQALEDVSPCVRVEAAGALANLGDADRALPVLQAELRSWDLEVALQSARSLQMLGEVARPALARMRAALADAAAKEAQSDFYMYLRFSLGAALESLESPGRSPETDSPER
jgi:arylsulfatase A-like enzyme